MAAKEENYLSKREQQIMEIIYRAGQADAGAVMAALPDALSNSAVRTHLRILETKGHLAHTEENGRFVYSPTKPRQRAGRAALATLLQTFFDDSVENVMATLLSDRAGDLKPGELNRLREMIDRAAADQATSDRDTAADQTASGRDAAADEGEYA